MKLLKLLPASGDHLTPREIVAELDKYIVGQEDAKRSVAIALRNRWRRQQSGGPRDEIAPKNIIMIGPTGVGKTEIARRLAKLAQSPFLKIEATKFTEVGYVGRDVESMVRDLMELAVNHGEGRRAGQGAGQGQRGRGRAPAGSAPPRPTPSPGTAEAEGDGGRHPGEAADHAPGRTPGRPLRGAGSQPAGHPGGGDLFRRRHGGDGLQLQGHAGQPLSRQAPSSARSRCRRPGKSCSRKRPAPHRHGPGGGGGPAQGGAKRHHLPG